MALNAREKLWWWARCCAGLRRGAERLLVSFVRPNVSLMAAALGSERHMAASLVSVSFSVTLSCGLGNRIKNEAECEEL